MTGYITTKRFRGKGISGKTYNLPYGTECQSNGRFIFFNGERICAVTSQNAYDHFSRDDDGNGRERGELRDKIMNLLAKPGPDRQKRWDRIWERKDFWKFRKQETPNHWLWGYDFYNADVGDLQEIWNTIKGG